MNMTFCPLFSGSSGNASVVRCGDTLVLVDAGMSARALDMALRALDMNIADVTAILITHEHSDHIKGVPILVKKYGLPVYASQGTWQAMGAMKGMDAIPARFRREFSAGEGFFVGRLDVQSHPISHDARDPVAYTLFAQGKKIAIATDTGFIDKALMESLMDADVVLMESNHDVELLQNGRYPATLKRRILGRHGHLSNDQCAKALVGLLNSRLRHIVLGHMSQHNNLPELAMGVNETHLTQAGVRIGRDITLTLARQDGPLPPFTL